MKKFLAEVVDNNFTKGFLAFVFAIVLCFVTFMHLTASPIINDFRALLSIRDVISIKPEMYNEILRKYINGTMSPNQVASFLINNGFSVSKPNHGARPPNITVIEANKSNIIQGICFTCPAFSVGVTVIFKEDQLVDLNGKVEFQSF